MPSEALLCCRETVWASMHTASSWGREKGWGMAAAAEEEEEEVVRDERQRVPLVHA